MNEGDSKRRDGAISPGDGFQAAHPRRWTPAGIFDTNHEDLKMEDYVVEYLDFDEVIILE